MKLSELQYSSLTDDEKFEIVMNGITDLYEKEVDDNSKVDLIVVLGCSPIPLEARIKKMMQLVRKGYSNNILLTGGNGWQKLYKKKDPVTGATYIDEEKKKDLLKAIRLTISANLLGDNPGEKERALFERFNEGMEQMMHEEVSSFEKCQEDKLLKLDEAEFMKLMILSNGGLKGTKIFHEPFSYNTRENMQNTKALVSGLIKRGELKKLDSLIVVSSSFHCRRAMLTFQKSFPGLKVIPCPATLDLDKRGVKLGREMLNNEYYKKQIDNECDALINYSKNGSIQDVELSELFGGYIMETTVTHKDAKEIDE